MQLEFCFNLFWNREKKLKTEFFSAKFNFFIFSFPFFCQKSVFITEYDKKRSCNRITRFLAMIHWKKVDHLKLITSNMGITWNIRFSTSNPYYTPYTIALCAMRHSLCLIDRANLVIIFTKKIEHQSMKFDLMCILSIYNLVFCEYYN